VGVGGHSDGNDGVVGTSKAQNRSGVYGFNSQREHIAYGVFGRCHAPEGAAVAGESEHGYGGSFSGGRAPLFLAPARTVGPPRAGSHLRGEFYVDSSGDLFYCKQDGEPGTWFRVVLTTP
jgi:hypothetical protein